MDISYNYQKKRLEFGRQCLFTDKGPEVIDNYVSNKKLLKYYILRDPVHRHQQCAPTTAEHHINTDRAEYVNIAVNHLEGGWPRDVNINDEEQTKRYRRKQEKEESYYQIMMQLIKNMEGCILQNNAINIYQRYFSDVEQTPIVEPSSARTVNVYQDQSNPKRPVTHISWSPDNQTKLAVSHCNMTFQAIIPNQTTHSYIWEVENPNVPLSVLRPEHACVCLEYNQKDPNILVSGQFNGQVAVWDMRKGFEPVDLSLLENSFRDPVHNVLWINSKSGTEFFSSSTDGQVKWWDTRKLSQPTEVLILDAAREDEQKMCNAMGASCLEYESTIPTRFMVGTEQGVVISCNRKGKTPQEKMLAKFTATLGPVLALQRNPAFVKNFLTVGDWTAKIWAEDCRESAIMWTSFHRPLLTDGCWSPTRYSVFFTTRTDGILDCWDILQQQKQASLSVKICDDKLRAIRASEVGRLVAVASQIGTTYLVEFSENLATCNKNDKQLLTAMFERENHREKILEARNREIRLKQKGKSQMYEQQQFMDIDGGRGPRGTIIMDSFFNDKYIRQSEAEFFLAVTDTVDDELEMEEEEEEDGLTEDLLEMLETPPQPPPPPPEPEPEKNEKKDKKGKKKGKK